MNIVIPAARPLSVIDEALIDAARRVQLSPTKHKQAEQHYLALCEYIDRPGSSLHGKVHECFASGSFGTGTVVASNVTKAEYDVDVVVELKILHTANPEETPSCCSRPSTASPEAGTTARSRKTLDASP
jgi:hypothetical protein